MSYLVPLGLLVIFVFSLGAKSLESFARHKLEVFCRHRHAQKRLTVILKRHEDVAAAVSLARILSIPLFLVCVFLYDMPPSSENIHHPTVFLVLVPSIILAEFWLPRACAKLWGTSLVYFGWFLWSTTATLMHPLLLIDRIITLFFCRLAGHVEDEDAVEEEIRTIITEGHRDGLLGGDAREMIEGVIELRDVTVSAIMTPRTEMECISETLSWDEMLQVVTSTSHSRIPVYRETRDDIIGVILTKNLLRELARNESAKHRPWTELMSKPLFIPETKHVDALLQEFQNVPSIEDSSGNRIRGHLAIVLDEYGGVAGIVTLEDILEEIVGEIIDEHDTIVTTETISQLNDDTFDVLGRVRIDELNSQLGLHLPEEEDYDTVAGFIFSTLGHIPEIGESVDFEHEGKTVRLTVTDVTRRRIEKVRVERNC